jgi:rRNA biogenesis protein RRP5
MNITFACVRFGSADRGRTIFEGLLTHYPRRFDLWLQYLDQEIKSDDVALIRILFERLCSLNLSSKKMKHVFKRYLAFEKEHGDASAVQAVKDKVVHYLNSKS